MYIIDHNTKTLTLTSIHICAYMYMYMYDYMYTSCMYVDYMRHMQAADTIYRNSHICLRVVLEGC